MIDGLRIVESDAVPDGTAYLFGISRKTREEAALRGWSLRQLVEALVERNEIRAVHFFPPHRLADARAQPNESSTMVGDDVAT